MKIDKINADCVMNVSNARINVTRRKKYSSVSFEFKDNKNFPGLNLKKMYWLCLVNHRSLVNNRIQYLERWVVFCQFIFYTKYMNDVSTIFNTFYISSFLLLNSLISGHEVVSTKLIQYEELYRMLCSERH